MWIDLLASYAFVVMASFFNACMDAFENEPNFNESIFKKWDKNFWLKTVSWSSAKKVFGYKIDGWHLSKSLMVISFACAIIFFRPLHEWWVHLITIGVLWNAGFWIFYHKTFGIK
jgi:hypothetical protein